MGDACAGLSLGTLLRGWRKRALLTQEQLAERAGLNVRTVRRIESSGLLQPRTTSVLLLAKALELNGAEQAILSAAAHGRSLPAGLADPASPEPPTAAEAPPVTGARHGAGAPQVTGPPHATGAPRGGEAPHGGGAPHGAGAPHGGGAPHGAGAPHATGVPAAAGPPLLTTWPPVAEPPAVAGPVTWPPVTGQPVTGQAVTGQAAVLWASVAGPPPVTVPRQLPADVAVLAGRDRELAIVQDHHSAHTVPVVCVNGMAGVGKTALAVHAAHRLAPLFPDGQLFVDLHGHAEATEPVKPGAVLARLLRTLGVPGEHIPWNIDDRAALYRSVLAGRRVLIVLDDADDEHQLHPLLPASPGCRVIVTSRRRLTCHGDVRNVSLDVLPVADAVTLFNRVAFNRVPSNREAANREAFNRVAGPDPVAPADVVAEVVRHCGLLPLAIRIAAARLRARPAWGVRHLLDRLACDRLAELTDGRHGVSAALDRSYQRLPAEQRRVYRLLGAGGNADFGPDTAAVLLDTSLARARRLLDQLLDAHLLQEPAPGWYRMHPLVHDHAAALWPADAGAHDRSCDLAAPEAGERRSLLCGR
ncbi:NB-ARC domain-containing protein [Nonomuraea sp. NPDC050404]|uniref:NB-ARC domain-containing protein n=1 Tax=Nonomuraea sp. NPDC050404 TaxID=3155783 RepID=UPI0033D15F62